MGCNVYNFMCSGGSFWGNPSQHNYPDQNCCKCGKGGPTPAPPKSPPRDKVSDQEWEHFQLVKQLRGQPGLAFECRLWMASQLHSQDMLDRVLINSHIAVRTSIWGPRQDRLPLML